MENLSIVTCISNVMIFVLLAMPGYVTGRLKLLTPAQLDGLSYLMMNFLWPAMLLDVMSSVRINNTLLHTVIYTGIISFIVYLLSLLIAYIYTRICGAAEPLAGILMFAIAFNNTGFIGMPFIKAVLGTEALFIASVIEVVIDILIFTVGIMLVRPDRKAQKSLHPKSLLTPAFVSILIGFAILGFRIPLPQIILNPVGYLSDATTAIAMFLVGAQFGEVSLKELFLARKAYGITFLRMILIPLLLYLVLFVFLKADTLSNTVLVLMFGMPTAACTAIMARQYRNHYILATHCVIMTTLCSAVMLPLWLLLTTADIF